MIIEPAPWAMAMGMGQGMWMWIFRMRLIFLKGIICDMRQHVLGPRQCDRTKTTKIAGLKIFNVNALTQAA